MKDFNPLIFGDKNKEKVQREAYEKWSNEDYKGTLEIATGVGKTMIGLMAIQQDQSMRWYIIVPKIDLMNQWREELMKNLNMTDDFIGRVGGGYNDVKAVTIAVVNSVRNTELIGNIIMDEMHRYGSEENFKFLENGNFNKILGLTATTLRQDGRHNELFKHAPLIFKYSQKEAIDQNILAEFELVNSRVKLTEDENFEYEKISNFISENFDTFNNNFNEVKNNIRVGGIRGQIAADLLRAFTRRRTILLNAKNKIGKTVLIVLKENIPKTLVFTEYIKTADAIVREFKKSGIKAGKYHSKMKSDEKNKMLLDFKENDIDVMVTVKSLDEGTNIPDCEMAIIVGGTSVPRQMIQRLGRILRTHEGKEIAKIYQLYIPDTKDYDWMIARQSSLIRNAKTVRWK